MKEIFKIAELISKEKVGELTDEERIQLNDWKAKGETEQAAYFYSSDSNRIQKKHDLYSKIDQDKSWRKITGQLPELASRPVIRMRTVLKWAAMFLLPILAATYLVNEVYWNNDQVIVEAGSSKATLKLSNGKTIYLEDFQDREIKSGKEKLATNFDNYLIYQKGEAQEEKMEYNTIRTPIKGEYAMVLSDGTKVWLNAQTELVYPVKFGKGKREVKLKGEAYFEVTKDTMRPFKVLISSGSDVEVLGTQFNVMAYEDEAEVQTTLVEGKVKFALGEQQLILDPGEQSVLNRSNNSIEVREVDTYQFSAWKDGKFVFNKEPLGSVFRKMSRWYGVDIACDDEFVLNRRISASMDKYENIDKLISLIEEVSPVKIDLDQKEIIVRTK
ncbi:MAG: FecR domain-containing protein [Marinifilaceae bacterium]|nr:FecR domain-containing protein [Marinifilaceae bacterium]